MDIDGLHTFDYFKKAKSEKAFTAFFDYYYKRLYDFANILVHSSILAEEVVLDVFMSLWKQKETLNSINNIEVYLFIAIRNRALSVIKKEQNFDIELLEDSHIELVAYKVNAEYELIEKEMIETLNDAVSALPPQCKIIFKLIREDGLSRSEAAEILNLSPKTIDQQVAIAVKKIATQLNIDLSNPSRSDMFMSFLFML